MTTHDRAVLDFIKEGAAREGIGLRAYCRKYGIIYTSLRGVDQDLDAAEREADLDALEISDDGQGRLERHMLGGWDDEAYRAHLAGLRRPRENGPVD